MPNLRRPAKRKGAPRGGATEVIAWPAADQPVTFAHALMAIAFGNAPVLARYLSETAPVPSQITRLIARMLDPSCPFIERNSRITDDSFWCGSWRLAFKRAGSGNRKNHPEKSMPLLRVGLFIEGQIRSGVTTKEAVHRAKDTFGVNRTLALDALRQARAFLNFKSPPQTTEPDQALLTEIAEFCKDTL